MANRIAFLSHSFPLPDDIREIQLLPAADFSVADGRSWKINSAIAKKLIDKLSAQTNALVIDYEHQTFLSKDNGKPAPAAGWLKRLEWREGQGLFAINVDWTGEAKDFIAKEQYRYISPSFEWDEESREILTLLPPGLTNFPAIDGMNAVTLSRLIQLSQESTMDRTALCKLLGIKEDATDAEITAAITVLKEQADKTGELETQVTTLKNNSTQTAVDVSRHVGVEVVEALKTQIATLTAAQLDREINDLIAPALADGRILPAQEQWARDLGKSNIAQLSAYIATAQPIAALKNSQTGGKPPADQNKSTLTPTQIALCKQMGLSEESYKQSLAAEAA